MTGAAHSFRVARTTAAAALLLAASAAATAVQAEETPYPVQADARPGGLAMAADVVIGRPLGLIGAVIGTSLFLVGLPFEALSGDVAGPGKRLVVEPLQFTFTRPLGEFR
jgi:hypothetical protein